jgi:hypothetical protein
VAVVVEEPKRVITHSSGYSSNSSGSKTEMENARVEIPISNYLLQTGLTLPHFIRHICISLPTFGDFWYGRARLYEVHIKNLELIREVC